MCVFDLLCLWVHCCDCTKESLCLLSSYHITQIAWDSRSLCQPLLSWLCSRPSHNITFLCIPLMLPVNVPLFYPPLCFLLSLAAPSRGKPWKQVGRGVTLCVCPCVHVILSHTNTQTPICTHAHTQGINACLCCYTFVLSTQYGLWMSCFWLRGWVGFTTMTAVENEMKICNCSAALLFFKFLVSLTICIYHSV